MEQDFCTIASNLNVSVGMVYRIYKLLEETGNVDPNIREYTGIKIDEQVNQVILSLVFSSLDLYLTEIKDKINQCTGLDISPPAICNVIYKKGLTRKKVQPIASQRSAIYRGDYIAEMSMYHVNMLVLLMKLGRMHKITLGDMDIQCRDKHHNLHSD